MIFHFICPQIPIKQSSYIACRYVFVLKKYGLLLNSNETEFVVIGLLVSQTLHLDSIKLVSINLPQTLTGDMVLQWRCLCEGRRKSGKCGSITNSFIIAIVSLYMFF